MRKKKHPEHVNHERWLISYADFITLLFAFFVVMFAVSRVDTNQVGRFTESFSKAVGIDVFPQSGKGLMPKEANGISGGQEGGTEKHEMKGLKEALDRARAADADVQILYADGEIIIRLPVHFAFDSGDCALRSTARPLLKKIAKELGGRPVDLRVEGHTDDRPIQTARFRSNWELSTCRATAVVIEMAGDSLPASRISASGYGEFHPIAANDTAEGRARNRRVDIVVRLRPAQRRVQELEAGGDAGAPLGGGT